MNYLRILVGASSILTATISRADTINWGSEVLSVNLQSDGSTPVTANDFTIQLGKFADGFLPDGNNVDLWASNWLVFDELLPGGHHQVPGYFTSEPQLMNNNTFRPGDQAYVWMFNQNTAVPGSEWLLYTNDDTDGSALDDWLFPQVTGSQQTLPLSWRVSNSSHVLFGGLDPRRGDPNDPRYGMGVGDDPDMPFNLQTRTFVPEPASAMLGLSALLILNRRRRPLR
jgi:hypothetical protein